MNAWDPTLRIVVVSRGAGPYPFEAQLQEQNAAGVWGTIDAGDGQTPAAAIFDLREFCDRAHYAQIEGLAL